MISFKANFISSAQINRISTNTPVRTSFVELSPFHPQDVNSLQEISELWKSNGTFARHIKDNLLDCNWMGYNNRQRFFALTLQRDKFEKLAPDEVLGLAHIIEGKDQIKIKYLQTDPCNKYQALDREFSEIGTSILDSLKKLFNRKIRLTSTPSAKRFYKKYGLEQIKKTNEFILKP